jgi:cysteine desulfurase
MPKTMKVYLDNAATTKVDAKVLEAMKPYFTQSYGNPSSLHSFGREANDGLESARNIIAAKINAEPSEIIFTSGGTESDNLAIKGAAYANREKGNHIITSPIEHPAVLNACKALEKEGFTLTILNVNGEGFIDLEQLKQQITPKTILVTIMHANNEVGTIQDIGAIGKICQEKGVLFHSDAVQSLTKVPIDVKKTNVDMLSFSAHKIHGPKGIGALYIKKGTLVRKIQDGGSQEFHRRAGTENVSGAVGFAKAAELVKAKELSYITRLRDRLIVGLQKIPDTQLNGPTGAKRLCNNVNFVFNFIEGEAMLLHLDMKGIAVSTGSACSQRDLKPSHVLTAMGLRPDVAHGSIRFSLSRFNNAKEIDYTVKRVKDVVKNLRAISPLRRGQYV